MYKKKYTFSPWASYQAPLPPHLWPEAFFRMTHHLAMHNMINELSAYIFTARGLAFKMVKYRPAGLPSTVYACLACAGAYSL